VVVVDGIIIIIMKLSIVAFVATVGSAAAFTS
jgi:hypothetical protein